MIIVAEGTCREYRAEYAQRLRTNAAAAIDGCPPSLQATWSIAVEYAHEMPPAGLAWPALAFAAMLDASGIPAAVLTAPAACAYITGRPEVGPDEQTLVRTAYDALERLGLAAVDATSSARTVWLHASVRSCVRAYLTPASIDSVVQAAATALAEAWPPSGAGPELSQALRDCAAALHAFAGDLLWKPEAHPTLVRAGASLMEAPMLADAAIQYWQAMSGACGQLLGPGHAQSVFARGQLADAYAAAGRPPRRSPRPRRRWPTASGSSGPSTRTRSPRGSTRPARSRRPGARPRRSRCTSRRWGRASGCSAGSTGRRWRCGRSWPARTRRPDAARTASGSYEQTRSDAERALGPLHQDTLAAEAGLAARLRGGGPAPRGDRGLPARAGRPRAGERARSPGHAGGAGAARERLRLGGKLKDAIAQYERVLADRSRVLGAGPPRHDHRPRQPRLRLPQRRAAEGRPAALRTGGGRPRADRRPGPPRHHRRPGRPRRRLPAGAADAGCRERLRARGRRRRPGARPGRRRGADHQVQPGGGVLRGRAAGGRGHAACPGPWPTASATWARTTR